MIKGSKKKYSWEIEFNGKKNRLDFYYSVFSSKFQINLNGIVIAKKQSMPINFKYKLAIDDEVIYIIQNG